MKTILWHTWEPGLDVDANMKTSGGGAFWTKYLWKKMEEEGHAIKISSPFAKKDDPLKRINIRDVKDVDLIILCWRWLLPLQYEERNKYYFNQMEIINEAVKHHVPIIVHDQDHKISESDFKLLLDNDARLTAPELYPRNHFSKLMFPCPYEINDTVGIDDRNADLIYVGNNYERYDQFRTFFGGHNLIARTHVWGNWLEKSPNREAPATVKDDCPNVEFKGRLDQSLVIETMAKSRSTIFLAKNSYCSSGFVTIRWAEAAAANCPGFIPDDFKVDHLYGKVTTQRDILNMLGSQLFLDDMLYDLKQFVALEMTPENWLNKIDDITKGGQS